MKTRSASNHHYPIYSVPEELINIYSHALGVLLSVVALVFLVLRAARETGIKPIASFSIFGASLVLLYVTSTLYHRCTIPERRMQLRIVDHVTIFVLIAGTYTPFALLTLQGWLGWTIFGICWGLALSGAALKLFHTGRNTRLSTFLYVLMGWLILVAIVPLTEKLPAAGLLWLLAGGLLYSAGAILYCIRKLPFNHAIFHCLVLAGSACHFVSVYFYVLPVRS